METNNDNVTTFGNPESQKKIADEPKNSNQNKGNKDWKVAWHPLNEILGGST
jgi:hypothetical protein